MQIEKLYEIFTQHPTVTTDTRQCTPGAMFFALKGETFDGNKFATQALEKGCSHAIIDEAEYAVADDPRYIVVDNVLTTLQQLARHHRRAMGTKVIGVTGTNGKTTTKELIATVLSQKYNVLYTQGNFNNDIGVPKTLLQLNKEHVLRGKEGSVVFIDNGNDLLKGIAGGLRLVTYGTTGEEDLCVGGEVLSCAPMLQFRWRHGTGEWHKVATHLIGTYNVTNMLAAACIGLYFGVEPQQIDEALSAYCPTNNRSQLTITEHNRLVVDAYNANPTSMNAALCNFRDMEVSPKMAILGAMRELGESSEEEHRKVISFLLENGFGEVWLIGEEFNLEGCPYPCFHDVEEVKKAIAEKRPEGYYILIKGSNSTRLFELPALL